MKLQIHVFKKIEAANSFAEELKIKDWETKVEEIESVVIFDQGDPEDPDLRYEARSVRWVLRATK